MFHLGEYFLEISIQRDRISDRSTFCMAMYEYFRLYTRQNHCLKYWL
ncbi:hypothetical protein PBCV1_a600aR [Paramecium bursaria Chlorella virus 1]|uniref:Uncharacterized protein n=1 Tax=Paramecium bursaria Chlorella virus 1 TaxID=10506 RepID=F8TU66_PBCV1|nr:hypothetical protein PBCV1_a600aR [Paramecium bursaria Chlorella virus 1]AEI70127.1 hypothetical protein [Paramecium bursaria Chlorella virus 1]